MRFFGRCCRYAMLVLAVGSLSYAASPDYVCGPLVNFNDNGGWSWLQGRHAVAVGDMLLVSSIASSGGAVGAERSGSLEISMLSLKSRQVGRVTIGSTVPEDANVATLFTRLDDRFVAVYGPGGSDTTTHWRRSLQPRNASTWEPEETMNVGVGARQANVLFLQKEGRTYLMTTRMGSGPAALISTDYGATWPSVVQFFRLPESEADGSACVKYATNGSDTIFFLATAAHPSADELGPYCGYLKGGQLYRLDGTAVGKMSADPKECPDLTAFTPVKFGAQASGSSTFSKFWPADIAVDTDGRPRVALSASDGSNHWFCYGSWTGKQWNMLPIANAGGSLCPAADPEITGGLCLDPDDPGVVYLSTPISPLSKDKTTCYEIYRARLGPDNTWRWSAVTRESTFDNLTPTMPKWSGTNRALIWLRGNYASPSSYNLCVVGLLDTASMNTPHLIQYVDATEANTNRLNATGTGATGVAAGMGACDNRWHHRNGRRTNNDDVYSADENGAEDCPVLRTSVAVPAGTYDVYVCFWSKFNELWQIRAGLSRDSLTLFTRQCGQHVTPADFARPTVCDNTGGEALMYRAYVGRTTLATAGNLEVYIKNGTAAGANTFAQRTWYDGIGYSRLVPGKGAAPLSGNAE